MTSSPPPVCGDCNYYAPVSDWSGLCRKTGNTVWGLRPCGNCPFRSTN